MIFSGYIGSTKSYILSLPIITRRRQLSNSFYEISQETLHLMLVEFQLFSKLS